MSKLTFLEAANGKRMGKTFSTNTSISYPKVKALNSHEYEPATLQERFDLIVKHAALGHCMFRGELTKILHKESRKKLTDLTKPNPTLFLDVDNLYLEDYIPSTSKLRSSNVESICERVLAMLPIEMQRASYIGHASSSMGRSESKFISVHIEFMLDSAINPTVLKKYIEHLNYSCDGIKDNLLLSDNSTGIKCILDPCVADNTHLIYISPPVFQGIDDPFHNPEHRFCLVEKENAQLRLTGQLASMEEKSMAAIQQKTLDALRNTAGLKRYRPKKKDYMTQEGKVRVVINPDQFKLTVCSIDEEYVRFNSDASNNYKYWAHLTSPHNIHCWNGDDSFEYAKADADGYAEFVSNYKSNIDKVTSETALVFRDIRTDNHYTLLYDVQEDELMTGLEEDTYIYESNVGNLEGWLSEYGQPLPDPIPSLHYVYNPHETTTVRYELNGLVNKYQAPKHVKRPHKIEAEFQNISYEPNSLENMGGTMLKALCPNIYKIMWHMTGSTQVEFEHFINWLAAAIDKKEPLQTVWIFSGTQGTGKGLFFNFILSPMIGENNVAIKAISALEDNFNSYLSDKLFVVIDEFHITDSKQDQRTFDKIKLTTGGERVDVRAMYKESKNMKMFANFIFFSNHVDVARLDDEDRRHNIGFPQPMKIKEAYPELFANDVDLKSLLASEIKDLYAFLHSFDYNYLAATTCIENDAKRNMRVAGMGVHQKFCFALREGDLDYFVENINALNGTPSHLLNVRSVADKVLAKWIEEAANQLPSDVSTSEAHAMYLVLNPDSNSTAQKFATMLTRNDVAQERKRKNGVRAKYVVTRFKFTDYDATDFLDKAPTVIPAEKRVTNMIELPPLPKTYDPDF
jgi:hypothetical protein